MSERTSINLRDLNVHTYSARNSGWEYSDKYHKLCLAITPAHLMFFMRYLVFWLIINRFGLWSVSLVRQRAKLVVNSTRDICGNCAFCMFYRPHVKHMQRHRFLQILFLVLDNWVPVILRYCKTYLKTIDGDFPFGNFHKKYVF